MGSHTGTHVDAPMHFISTGNSGVDKVPLEKLTGEAIILDVSEKTIGEGITNVDLDIYSKIVKPDDIVLLYTGTSDHWDQNESIMQNYTYLEPSAAKWIVDHNIKCIEIDSVSV
jgi:kynurenine formamidase